MPVNQPKKPRGKDNYVGVEIEFFAPYKRDALWEMFNKDKLCNYLHLKDDGSIEIPSKYQYHDNDDRVQTCSRVACSHRCTNSTVRCCQCGSSFKAAKSKKKNEIKLHHSHELAILVKQEEMEDVVTRVCTVLKTAEAKVNASCGLHVHLDMRNREPAKCYSNLVLAQSLLFKLVNKNRKDNDYCQTVDSDADFDNMVNDDRYYAINATAYNKFETLEVRMHHGTVDGEKIVNWVCLLLETISSEPLKKMVRTFKDIKHIKVSPKVLQYVAREARKRA